MQDHDWNDLRYFLALARTGSRAEAARKLSVNETTIARRLQALERALRITLFVKQASGRYRPTNEAQALLEHAERIELANAELAEAAGATRYDLEGEVRVTCVPLIANHFVIPAFASFHDQHPGIKLEVIADARNADLSRREADLALRFARPERGGSQVKARRLGGIGFAVYEAASESIATSDKRWIGYGDGFRDLPQAQWIEREIEVQKRNLDPASEAFAQIRVGDVTSAIEAVRNGLGRSLLPIHLASEDETLRLCGRDEHLPVLVRDVWLLSHADQTGRHAVEAAKAWLEEIDW